jgi:regulator of sigma E protease
LDGNENVRPSSLNGAESANDIPESPSTAKPWPAEPANDTPEPEPTLKQWANRNIPLLVLLGALVVFLYIKFEISGLWAITKAALGLSFVVFIHELGHFLVAKWCDVHVTTFSIGFGPPLPGCSFQWGETTYKLALFPLGGYVQMVGQTDGDESSDGSEDDPRSYRNKSVGQRMAIISAGVVMNAVLAIVCFVVVFQGPGKDRRAAVVDSIEPGSPAFRAGIRTGAEFLQVGDIKNPYFENLMSVVMATQDDEKVKFVYKRPGDKEAITQEIEPRLSKENTRPMIGVAPAEKTVLVSRRYVAGLYDGPVYPGSAASRSELPFQFGDRIIATTDPDHPAQIKDLPIDPRDPTKNQCDYFEFHRRMQLLAGKPVVIRVERVEGQRKTNVDIKVPPTFHYTLGTRMQMGEISSLRKGSPAEQAGVHARDTSKKLEGDVILRVEVRGADGSVLRFGEPEPIDPLRLPFDLQQWADSIYRSNPRAQARDLEVTLHVRRHNAQPGQQYRTEVLKLVWDNSWRFDKIRPFASSDPLAIPELGLAYQVKTTVAHVSPNDAGKSIYLQKDDVIKKVRLTYLDRDGEKVNGKWVELEPEEFAWVFWNFQSPNTVKEMTLEIERDKKREEITVQAHEDTTWPLDERGLMLTQDMRRQKADGILEAIALGFQDTGSNMLQVLQNLRGMLTGRISVKNLGGPLTIANIAYRFAGYDFWEFVFFIGLISVNLAVINFLPIPVLDGGHMVFLIYEKLRGKPATEGVRVGATYAGLALILGIMVFVLFQDITRLFRG